MQVKLKISLAGPRGAWRVGDVTEVNDAQALELIRRGQAEAVGKSPPERTVAPAGKR